MLSIETLIDSPRWLKVFMNRNNEDTNAFLSEILLGEGEFSFAVNDATLFCTVELHYRHSLLRKVLCAWSEVVSRRGHPV
jgi:hypothetical protein